MNRLESIIEEERPNLASNDKVALRGVVSRIEAKISTEETSEQWSAERILLQLVKVGLELENTDLLLILVARLKLGQLALVLQSTLQLSREIGKLFAMHYVAEYFHIDHPSTQKKLLEMNHAHCDTIFDLKSLVELLIDSNDWKEASEFSNHREHGEAMNRIVCLKLAHHYEAMENFYEALINYEASETHTRNSFRIITKQFLDSSWFKLREYCSTKESLKSFWYAYCSLFSSKPADLHREEPSSDQSVKGLQIVQRSGFLPMSDDSLRKPIDTLPEIMSKFILGANDPKNWSNARTIERIISMAASLDSSTRHHLSTAISEYLRSNCIPEACASFLCLNEFIVASQLSSRFLSQCLVSQLNYLLCLPEESAVNLLRLARSRRAIAICQNDRSERKSIHDSAFFSALNMGLLDETMRFYCDVCPNNEDSTKRILDNLENLIATRHVGALERIDPTIRNPTLSMLRQNIASERIPITPVISIIINCMVIYTYKLDYPDCISIPIRVIRVLEDMFKYTSKCMKGYNFNASVSLVRSTSALVTAIKEKLEIVSDSEIIRVGVKNLVESVASRCLVESQFKQAATLYSLIEDHASAVKSLMRLGDIDTVVNYSLLVRDITVHRLTINYLKHLDVDMRTIEEFITKSKQ